MKRRVTRRNPVITARDTVNTPEVFGAFGDGTTNAKAAFESARAAGAVLAVYPGRVYRISADTTAGVVLNFGGLIQIDSGKTLTFDDVVGADNQVLFTGDGTARSSSRRYSVGWYGDGDLADAWDFCRRGFETNVYQTCVFPQPRAAQYWTHSRPLQFDDPENRTVYTMNCLIQASASMDEQLLFSPTNKTEDITFYGKVDLDGNDLATNAVNILGGARIRFNDILSGWGHLGDVVRLYCTTGPSIDEFYANFIYGARYGGYVLNAIGHQGPIHMMQIGQAFCNGVRTGGANGVANFEGLVIGSEVSLVSENGPVATGIETLADDKPIVRIAAGDHQWSSQYRAPVDLRIGRIFTEVFTKTLLKVEKGGTSTTVKPSFTVGGLERFRTVSAADKLADIDWVDGVTIRCGRTQQDLTTAVSLGSNVSNLRLDDVDAYRVKNPSGVWSKVLINGQCRVDADLTDDSVITMDPTVLALNGILHLHCGQGTTGWAILAYRGGGDIAVILKGTDVEIATTALTGTTGTDGKFTVGVTGQLVYLENRLGVSRRISASI